MGLELKGDLAEVLKYCCEGHHTIACKQMNVPNYLESYILFDTRDEGLAHDGAARSFVPHKLNYKRGGNDFHFIHCHAVLNDVSLSFTSYGTDLVIQPEAMDDFYLIQIQTPIYGNLAVEHGSAYSNGSAGLTTIVSPSNSTRLFWSNNCGLLTVKISRSAIENQLSKLIQSDIDKPVIFDLEMDLGNSKTRNWLIETLRLKQFFQKGVVSEDKFDLEKNFESRYAELLLTCQNNNYSQILDDEYSLAPSKAVSEAIDYLHQYMSDKITLGELADVVNTNARTLHNGFKRYCGQSPMAYLNSIRLRQARQKLVAADDNQNVTSIAQGLGFTHLGRFSQQYYQKYAEKPSDTLNRAK